MRDSVYRKRLAADLPRWREAGWLTDENAAAILASVDQRRSMLDLSTMLGLLGSILLGLGVLAFVAANWEEMPRLLRFAVLVGAMAAAYAAAGSLHKRDYPGLADAAILLACLVFGAAIALIGQSYHLAGEFSDALLLWAVGCLGAAFFARSTTATVLVFVAAGYLTWLAMIEGARHAQWQGLALIALGIALATWRDHPAARVCGVLSLGFWIAVMILALGPQVGWSNGIALAMAAVFGLFFWSLGSTLAGRQSQPRLAALGFDFLWPSLAATLVAVALLQITALWSYMGTGRSWMPAAVVALAAATVLAGIARLRRGAALVDVAAVALIGGGAIVFAALDLPDEMPARLLGGILVLGAASWAISLGQRGIRPIGKKTGLVLFGLEILYLYVVTLGTVLDTAVAFLFGGLLFIGLSIALLRIDRRLGARAAA